MTIRSAGDRLWSGLSTDRKPENWAPGIMLLETDTGIWWVTGEDRVWVPCYATAKAFGLVLAQANRTEQAHAVLETRVAALQAQVNQLQADVNALKARPRP